MNLNISTKIKRIVETYLDDFNKRLKHSGKLTPKLIQDIGFKDLIIGILFVFIMMVTIKGVKAEWKYSETSRLIDNSSIYVAIAPEGQSDYIFKFGKLQLLMYYMCIDNEKHLILLDNSLNKFVSNKGKKTFQINYRFDSKDHKTISAEYKEGEGIFVLIDNINNVELLDEWTNNLSNSKELIIMIDRFNEGSYFKASSGATWGKIYFTFDLSNNAKSTIDKVNNKCLEGG